MFPAVFNLLGLNGTNGFTLIGNSESVTGASVCGTGDINGDGIDDIGISAPSEYSSINGQDYVIFGSKNGFPTAFNLMNLNGTNGFTIFGPIGFGNPSSISGAGDINGDGINDIIIGAPSVDLNVNFYKGQSYVIFGSKNGFNSSFYLNSLNGTNGFAINGGANGDQSGFSVAGAGDVNGDNIDDIIIGAPYADSDAGRSYVVFGSKNAFNASLNLNSLNGANGFILIGGNSDDGSGWSVSGAGDVNGDGIADVIIGVPKVNTFIGQSYVVFGSRNGFSKFLNVSSLNGTSGFIVIGRNSNEVSGVSVNSAGDVNGDGVADMIIGAPGANYGAGGSYVVFGSKIGGFSSPFYLNNLNGNNGFILNGINVTDGSGSSVSGVGDINGDGIADIIIGASGANDGAGQSYVVFGSRNGFMSDFPLSSLNGFNGFALDGINSGDQSGYSVSGAGDINGDGINDMIIGAPHQNNNAGQSYIVYGQNTSSINTYSATQTIVPSASPTPSSSITPTSTSSQLSPSFSQTMTPTHVLPLFPASFSVASLTGWNGFAIVAATHPSAVSGVGDVNGDGIADIIIGAGASNTAGTSYVIFGSRSISGYFMNPFNLVNLGGWNGFALTGVDRIDQSGYSVSSAGDINGDGIDDMIIGALHGGFNVGRGYVIFGSSSGFTSTFSLANVDGENGFMIAGRYSGQGVGCSVSRAGDVNGDGIDDIIIGALTAENDIFGQKVGQSYVIFGSKNGFSKFLSVDSLNGTNGFVLNGINFGDNINSVSNAGDVNGDNITDIIIGAPSANNGVGQSYVIFGSRSGFPASFNLANLNGTNGFIINGISSGDKSGTSVKAAGDFNGDGVDDVIIGAPGAGYNTGQSYVVFGSKNGFSTPFNLTNLNGTNGFGLNSINAAKYNGMSVSGAGDVNNDGIDDIIIGAINAKTNIGQSYVVFGSNGGFVSPFNLSSLNGVNGFVITGLNPAGNLFLTSFLVSGVGDFNNDGVDDVIVTDPTTNLINGQSYVVFGRSYPSFTPTPSYRSTPSYSSTPIPHSPNDGGGEVGNLGVIIGATVGAVVGISLIGLGLWWAIGNSCFGRKVLHKGVGEVVPNIEMAVKAAGVVVAMNPVGAKAEEIIDTLSELIGYKSNDEVVVDCTGECLTLNATFAD